MLVMESTFFDPKQLEAGEALDRGLALRDQNRFTEALVEFEKALEIDPENRYAPWNRAVALLSLGDYANGLPQHDTAWKIHDFGKGPLTQDLPLPVWKGERCRLLSFHNMGFGDAIMLLRFLPEMVARCESVTLVVRQELVRLFEGYGATIVNRIPDVTKFDAQVTFFNSTFTMGHTLDTIPRSPYIPADFKLTGGRMGIAWSGNSRRELDCFTFLSFLYTRGFNLYAMQKTRPSASYVFPLAAKDFKETSECMMTMDHIVTVDTAAAHLAGAMGHPSVHLLLPFNRDWRWWHHDVWYPTINIYAQDNPDDWSEPFERLNEALHQ